jgi:hypothetical protein
MHEVLEELLEGDVPGCEGLMEGRGSVKSSYESDIWTAG